MTASLQRRLNRLEQKHGKDSPKAQWLRDQIASEQSGQTAQQMYVVGMAKKQTNNLEK
jgi:hypothetical protein